MGDSQSEKLQDGGDRCVIPRVTIESNSAGPASASSSTSLPVETTGLALHQHDQIFYRQIMQLRQQQAAQQQLLQQQFNLQRQLLLDSQEKTLKSHFMDYLEQHKRLEEVNNKQDSEKKKSDVKHRLQEFVLHKKHREMMNSGSTPARSESFDDISSTAPAASETATEGTDAEVWSLLSSSCSFLKALPRISPVQEDEYLQPSGIGSHYPAASSRSSRSRASPLSVGSSSSSLLQEDYRGLLAAPPPYLPSPPRHGKLRPVGRTQSAPLPLGHPGLLAPPDVRPGKTSPKTSPELDTHTLVKHQIRQSVLSRQGRVAHSVPGAPSAPPGESFKSLDPMLAMAELSQIQNRCFSTEDGHGQSPVKTRHSSQEGGAGKSRPKPISRTRSSPLVSLAAAAAVGAAGPVGSSVARTGLAWDPVMLQHACLCGDELLHPESPGRLERIIDKLRDRGLLARCELVRRRATMDELKCCHSEQHVQLFGVSPVVRENGLGVVRLACGGWGVDSDTIWNHLHTPTAAKVAAGSLIELVNKVGSGSLRNGFGLIRPPGHHAEEDQALGFCFFNNIAIAARQYRKNFNKRVAILDWDVHHGNGTQKEFYADPEVLYVSIHRHDGGNFFPGTGSPSETGSGAGLGRTVNIAWSSSDVPLGDAEYLAALRSLVLPLLQSFDPGLILVSAGFDGTGGHPPTLGGYSVSPSCFGILTTYLMHLADGKVVLGLEGGYIGEEVGDSVVECVGALLGDVAVLRQPNELHRVPIEQAVQDINLTVSNHACYWPILTETCKFAQMTHSQYLDSHPLDINAVKRLQMV